MLLAISGCFQRSTVSSLSARPPRRNHHCTHSQQSIDDPLPQNGGVSRRDWLVAGACSGLLWSNNHAAAAADSQPRLAPEYYDPSNVVTDPSAGRSYFPALTPPFFDRATYKYTLGRNTWALEQLLTFANVTATIRTTVVKLQSTGGLWVHSPQWPTGEFCALLESIGGPVEHVVLPCNAFEHKAPLQAFVERYPNAKVWIAPGQYGPLGKNDPTTAKEREKAICDGLPFSHHISTVLNVILVSLAISLTALWSRELRDHSQRQEQQAPDGIQGGRDSGRRQQSPSPVERRV